MHLYAASKPDIVYHYFAIKEEHIKHIETKYADFSW
jgi:hypothetical protein